MLDLDQFAQWLRRTCGQSTINAYLYTARHFIDWLDGEGPSPRAADEYLTHLSETNKNSSLSRHYYALKAFFEWLGLKEEFSIIRRPRQERAEVRWARVDDIVKIINAEKHPIYRLMFTLQFAAGLRVSELLSMNRKDLENDGIMVKGKKKRGKARTDFIEVQPEVLTLVNDYLESRRDSEPAMFVNDRGERVRYPGYCWHLNQACDAAGVERLNTHALRHSRATDFLIKGGKIYDLKVFLRHGSIKSTEVYAHVTGTDIKGRVPPAFTRDEGDD